MTNSLDMRNLYARVEGYLTGALQGQKFDNFEILNKVFLVDNFQGLNFRFELPQQLGINPATKITVCTMPALLSDAKTPEDISEGLESILASLKSLLVKRDLLEQRGYRGEFYQNEKMPLEEMGYIYTVRSATEEEIKHVIDNFIL